MTRWTDDSQLPSTWMVEGWSGVSAWCTGRQGGVSLPPYASLNVSRAVGDLESSVAENRRRALARAGGRRPVWGRLVHGADAVWIAGDKDAPAADALLTRDPGVVLGMTYADCVPLLIAAPDEGVVGVAHAGWRGTVQNIAGRLVAELARAGIAASALHIAVGPAIGPCCYQVDRPVADRVRDLVAAPERLGPDGPEHWRLDLPGLNADLFAAAGVPAAQITQSRLCTACHPDWFFSHRGDGGRTGRQGAFICLSPR
jgi:YfiH family protein